MTYDDLRNVAVLYQLLHRLESDIEGRIARRLAELADTLSDETALMARNNEAANCKYTDLSGTTLTLYGKQHKTRTVEISQRLADSIAARRNSSKSELLFPNRVGKPDTKMCRSLQNLAKRAGAKFHTELHKLRKTGASRRYLSGVGLPTLMLELGHESLATTQKYLADVRREDEIKKAVADADYIPKLKIVRTGT